MCKAGPERYMAENIPIYAYAGIPVYWGKKGIWGFSGARINFKGLGGWGHTYPNAT
jgi:hypothetical protein